MKEKDKINDVCEEERWKVSCDHWEARLEGYCCSHDNYMALEKKKNFTDSMLTWKMPLHNFHLGEIGQQYIEVKTAKKVLFVKHAAMSIWSKDLCPQDSLETRKLTAFKFHACLIHSEY